MSSAGQGSSSPTQLPPAGWYPDPAGANTERWWDGEKWTDSQRPTTAAVPSNDDTTSAAHAFPRVDAAPPSTEAKGQSNARPTWFYPLIAAMAVLFVVAVSVMAVIQVMDSRAEAKRVSDEASASAAAVEASASAEAARFRLIPDAVNGCGLSESLVGDDGASVFLNGEGDDYDSSDTLTIYQTACVLAALDIPDAVMNHMQATRALDGTQTDSWGELTASWTYHPDNGLDVLVRLSK